LYLKRLQPGRRPPPSRERKKKARSIETQDESKVLRALML
jgi:hypothetical protein